MGVKAKVRAEIFAALDDEQVQRPELPRENCLINELIREYFEYNGYHHALSVLLPESGHPEERQFDRRFMASELRVQEDARSQSLPLIYALVRGLRPQLDPSDNVMGASSEPDAALPPGANGQTRLPDVLTTNMLPAGSQATNVSQLPSPPLPPPLASFAGDCDGGEQPPPMVIRG